MSDSSGGDLDDRAADPRRPVFGQNHPGGSKEAGAPDEGPQVLRILHGIQCQQRLPLFGGALEEGFERGVEELRGPQRHPLVVGMSDQR